MAEEQDDEIEEEEEDDPRESGDPDLWLDGECLFGTKLRLDGFGW